MDITNSTTEEVEVRIRPANVVWSEIETPTDDSTFEGGEDDTVA